MCTLLQYGRKIAFTAGNAFGTFSTRHLSWLATSFSTGSTTISTQVLSSQLDWQVWCAHILWEKPIVLLAMRKLSMKTFKILLTTSMWRSGWPDSTSFSKVTSIEQHVFYHTDKIALKSEKLEIISRPNNQTPNIWISQSGEESDLREFCFYIYDLNGDGYISRHNTPDWIATTN